MKTDIGVLGELELAVMRVCLDKGICTERMIFKELQIIRGSEYQTIMATLDRLVMKEFLTLEKIGSMSLYT